jgi:hypothetical protein
VAAAMLLLGAAVATTFVPLYQSGEPCGTWVAPELPSEEPIGIITGPRAGERQIQRLLDQAVAETAIFEQRCDERLDSRRLLSLILGGLAIALPMGVFVLGAGRRQRT